MSKVQLTIDQLLNKSKIK